MKVNPVSLPRPARHALSALVVAMALHATPMAAMAADAPDPMVEGAKQCTRFLPRYEREYGIPVHLLSAISSTESGRWHKSLGIALPWPWTINAEGKGYYYDSKEEAIAAARRLRAQGVKSMDIGCMQVNLVHHANAFSSLEDAFEPERNVAYAASFLRNLYEEQRSWRSAAAAYHSKTPSFGDKYVGRVYTRWYSIIDRLRNARLAMASAVGGVASGGGLTAAEAASEREASGKSQGIQMAAAQPAPAPAPVRLMPYVPVSAPAYATPKSPSLRMISVRDTSTSTPAVAAAPATAPIQRERGVLVIRPPEAVTAAPMPIPVAQPAAYAPPAAVQAQPQIVPIPQPRAEVATRLVPARAAVSAPESHPIGQAPRFIFND